MSRVYNNDMIGKFESSVLHRFKTMKELKQYYNEMFRENGFRVKEIAKKSYYDSEDESDYEILITIGDTKYDIYDLTVYYAKTRVKENIIVEVGYEEV